MGLLQTCLMVALLYSLSNAAPTDSPFTYYNLQTPLAGPCDLTTGTDGAIWLDTFLANKIARVDPATGALTEYDIPYTLGPLPTSVLPSDAQGRVALACVIQPGNDGKLYAATGIRNQVAKIDPESKDIRVFTPDPPNPLGNLEPFNDMWRGDEGMFFSQTTGNVITLFSYADETFTNYDIPTPLAGPLGMRVGADGALWFVEFFADQVGRLNQSTGEIQEFPVPLTGALPAVMRAETESRYLWFTCLGGNALGRIDEITYQVDVFTVPTPGAAPVEDDADDKGRVWFSTLTENNLNYYDPASDSFTKIDQGDGLIPDLPVGLPPAADIAIHYDGGTASMWFTELINNRVGRYRLS